MSKLCIVAIALLACGLNAEQEFSRSSDLLRRLARGVKAGSCGKGNVSPRKLSVATSQRIVGGMEAKPNSFPFIVSVQSKYGSHFCGGSLIRTSASKEESDIVVTAAHCVYDGLGDTVVVAGAHDVSRYSREKNQQKVAVRKAIYNPSYNPDTTMNDIAVLILESPIKFNENVQPICLPAAYEEVKDGTPLTVAGWGLTREGGSYTSDVLMQVSVPSISATSCSNSFKYDGISINGNAMLCAGYNGGGMDACQGDSGGPLFTGGNDGKDFVLRGVVSFGIGCARPNKPGVYAKTSNFLSWVNSQVSIYSRAI